MSLVFKCCRTRPQNNLICVHCHNVFHRSCIQRRSDVDYINDNLILCSADCSDRADDSDDPKLLSKLKCAFEELRNDLLEKTDYIERLKNSNLLLLSEAESSEVGLLNENKALKTKLNELVNMSLSNQQVLVTTSSQTDAVKSSLSVSCQTVESTIVDSRLAELRSANLALESDCNLLRDELRRCLDLVSELRVTNTEMISSIETLERDNKFLNTELDSLKRACADDADDELLRHPDLASLDMSSGGVAAYRSLYDEMFIDASEPCPLDDHSFPPTPAAVVPLRRRVLVVGDGTSRGIAGGLLEWLDCDVNSVYGECHRGFSISQLSSRLFQLTMDFNPEDSVVICIDLNSIGKLSTSGLNKLFSIGRYTNIIFSISFSSTDRHSLIKNVALRSALLGYNYNTSVRIFDNDIVNGKHRISKRMLCRNLSLYIRCSRSMERVFKQSCMIYVNLSDVACAPIRSDLFESVDVTRHGGTARVGRLKSPGGLNTSTFLG